MPVTAQITRFAPSPTGALHLGNACAFAAAWLSCRAARGFLLVRIEDVDAPRCPPGTAELILAQLARCGLPPDEPPWWQSTRGAAYQTALQRLLDAGRAFPCACTRRDVDAAWLARGT